MNRRYIFITTAVAVLFACSARGDVGSNNPTGTSGEFNGEVTTGGSYDPYTGNVTRSVTDLMVAGAVSTYPLAFSRTSTSRYVSGLTANFGTPGSWRHSYQWSVDTVTFSSAFYTNNPPLPSSYTVNYPDGRRIVFYRTVSGESQDYFDGPPGVGDRFEKIPSTGTFPRYCYLHLPDGGKVKFSVSRDIYDTGDDNNTTWFYSYRYALVSIIDPYGRAQTVSYPADGSMTISEPAGRTLKIFSINTTLSGRTERVIDHVTASDGRTVKYNYAVYTTPNGTKYTALTSVSYFPNSGTPYTATYSYRNDNVTVNGRPLLYTANDPMYQGPMKGIAYAYATGTNADNTAVVYGQLRSEWNDNPRQVVSALRVDNATTRTETRPDNKTRTFTYSTSGLLTKVTDFKGVAASQSYTGGYVTAVTDRNLHTTNYKRNALTGAVTDIEYPLTNDTVNQTVRPTVSFTYGSASCADPNNQDPYNPYYVCTATDEGGHVTRFTRDNLHRVTEIRYPDGGFETFTYNAFGQVSSHRMTTGGTETFGYDSTNNYVLAWHRDPYHQTGAADAVYQYEGHDWVSGVTDALGNTTNFEYNLRGQVFRTTHPPDPIDNVRHTFTTWYNTDGTVDRTVNEINQVTFYDYDAYKRLRDIITPLRFAGDTTPRTTYFYYDTTGAGEDYRYTDASVTWTVLPSGKKTKSVYDENRRKISVTAAVGTSDAATTTYVYDKVGNVTSVVAPNQQAGKLFAGTSTDTVYDERNRPKYITDALNNTTTIRYDTAGRRYDVKRPNGQTITYNSYDEMNRLLQQTATQTPNPAAVTKYTYTDAGLLATMKDPRLVALNSADTYSYTYDLMGRKTRVTYPTDSAGVHRTENWTYDAANRLDTFQNRAGKIQTFSYDALNRLTGFTWNDGVTPAVTFEYNAAGWMTRADNDNAWIPYAYYNDGRLKSETEHINGSPHWGTPITYTYDGDGNVIQALWPDSGEQITYSYTGRNQLKTVSDEGSLLGTFTYDVNGNLKTRVAQSNPTTTSTYTYDALNRVTRIAHAFNGTSRSFDYNYDNVGNRNWVERDDSFIGDVFDYDLADQVTAVKLNVSGVGSADPGPRTIVYDANGNRTSFAPYGTTDTYSINNLNQYTARNATPLSYDANGNMTTAADGSSYTYDAQNRLTSASKSGTTVTFKYDALNRVVSRTINGAAFYNVWDGWNLVINYDNTNTWVKAYWHGAGGLVGEWNGTFQYSYSDASGSTTHIADNTGHLLEWYRYDLDGTPLIYDANNNPRSTSAYATRHLFTGQQWYSELGLYDLRNRIYSPDVGRFLQGDPIGFEGDATNLYRYCGNNPLTARDPFGTMPWTQGGVFRWLQSPTGLGAAIFAAGVIGAGVAIELMIMHESHMLGVAPPMSRDLGVGVYGNGPRQMISAAPSGGPPIDLPEPGPAPEDTGQEGEHPRAIPPYEQPVEPFPYHFISVDIGNLPRVYSPFVEPGQSVVVPVGPWSGSPNGHYDPSISDPALRYVPPAGTPAGQRWSKQYQLSLNPSPTVNLYGGTAGTDTGGSAWDPHYQLGGLNMPAALWNWGMWGVNPSSYDGGAGGDLKLHMRR